VLAADSLAAMGFPRRLPLVHPVSANGS
jgi:hypothetical protein